MLLYVLEHYLKFAYVSIYTYNIILEENLIYCGSPVKQWRLNIII